MAVKTFIFKLVKMNVEDGKHWMVIDTAAWASLPLTSLLAFVWLYLDTGDIEKVAALSHGIFWLIIAELSENIRITTYNYALR
jgi:hypothetical protein